MKFLLPTGNILGCLLGAVLAFAAFIAHAADVSIQLPAEVNAFKQDVGAEFANGQCLICHSVEYVTTQPPMPRDFWKSEVQKMQQKYGAAVPEEQVQPLADYLARNYGAHTNGNAITAATPQAAGVEHTSAPKIATKYGCLGCHSPDVKIIGPAYRDIASKYRTDGEAAAKIEQQIHKGGSGKWGPIIMPPFPQVSPAETKVLTEWILGLK
jgi:cytochrome c551/c552